MVAIANSSALDGRRLGGAGLAPLLGETQPIGRLPAPWAVHAAAPLLTHLLRQPHLLPAYLPALLDRVEGRDPYVALRYDGDGHGPSLQVFVWPPGARTAIHDHSCWGLIACATGALVEERYTRLDDGARAGQAHIRRAWRRGWYPGAGVSTLLPYAGGIHRVANPTARPVLSVHIYGPPGAIDGRDYDPSHDFVCDR